MGTNLAIILTTFAVLTDRGITTQSFYLGPGPNGFGGLNCHSTVEADVSPNREGTPRCPSSHPLPLTSLTSNFYHGCGDNHQLSSRLFKQNFAFAAAKPSKQLTLNTMANQYGAIA